MQAGAHRGPGVARDRVVDVDILGKRRAAGGLLKAQAVETEHHCADGPRRRRTQQRLDAGEQVVDRAHHHGRARQADGCAQQALLPGAPLAPDHRIQAELERLEVDDAQQPDVAQGGGEDRVAHDLGIGDADVLDHQEGCRAHHRRHDLPVDRAHGLDGARLHATVACLLHQRDGEDAAADDIAHRAAGDHAVEGGAHDRHLRGSAAQVAERGEAHLHHVVAAAGPVEQRAEQHVDEDRTGGHAQRDAIHALGGQPEMREQAVQTRALVREHLGHPRSEHRVGDEDQRQRGHRPADGAAGSLEQQDESGAGYGDIHRRRLTGSGGQLRVEEQQIGAGEGACQGESPVDERHPIAGRAAEGRPGGEGEQQRQAEVQGACLGVGADAPAEREGQRRGVPELKKRPAERDRSDHRRGHAPGPAGPGVVVGHQTLQGLGRLVEVGGHDAALCSGAPEAQRSQPFSR